jgi:hypothetical protein
VAIPIARRLLAETGRRSLPTSGAALAGRFLNGGCGEFLIPSSQRLNPSAHATVSLQVSDDELGRMGRSLLP